MEHIVLTISKKHTIVNYIYSLKRETYIKIVKRECYGTDTPKFIEYQSFVPALCSTKQVQISSVAP